ncbi:PQQ-dependent sugar dehydrogenase [Pseudoalteromonas obscura]|uniref:PQQ-dependent sugar dehydrogenase n=1 Tax=Pseudoalteromonas obscura TaxID=3048491 RepID=A0ABT7EMC6_9GAMM|nr:PQQ-dependent sugar dehydrogenase [Pseudoalteromonas sp. P94(2023)]MDK2596214.1 PQQ-dependent sugar dehydrogenase [Pseudoalteromonas sp. P94(2023)]
MKTINFVASIVAALGAAINQASANENVEDIFKNNCASCHGAQLQGAMAGSLLDTQWITDGSDKALANAIKNGLLDRGMPAFGHALTEQTIRTLVVYIRETSYNADTAKLKTPTLNKQFKTNRHNVNTQEVLSTKGIIWALDFLPDGSLIYTLRQGELWHVDDKGNRTHIKNTPKVWHRGQGGMLDVLPDPDYQKNGWIYLSYSKKTGKDKAGRDIGITAIVRGKIKNGKWTEQQTLFEAPKHTHKNRGWHFGSRFTIDGEYLYFTNGDEGHQDDAQDLTTQNGKVHRIYKDGRIPKDNPFYNKKDSLKTIWTYGNRNPQGLVKHPKTNQIWSTEHGPRGGDELNLISKGVNYGWPKTTFGMNYDGSPITPHTDLPGMQLPVHQWTPSIAVAGMNFYTGSQFKHWQGDLFVGSLAKKQLHRIRFKGNQVIEDEIILKGLGRIRDVVTAPSGELFITVNDRNSNTSKIVALSAQK